MLLILFLLLHRPRYNTLFFRGTHVLIKRQQQPTHIVACITQWDEQFNSATEWDEAKSYSLSFSLHMYNMTSYESS